ncbi:MAG TPA: hypothetical protein VNO14_10325 [Blastocatellia bacterium]|nr:hypothetical protein [Blastocatellia bacterium]
MKRLFLAILIAVFGITALGSLPVDCSVAYTQKKEDKKKKDPPGPPVVRDKPKEKPKDNKKNDKPKKGKKPGEY